MATWIRSLLDYVIGLCDREIARRIPPEWWYV
jgi:hypothetical protein